MTQLVTSPSKYEVPHATKLASKEMFVFHGWHEHTHSDWDNTFISTFCAEVVCISKHRVDSEYLIPINWM
jgi:hypothetical protein